ncbi:MAG TPA: phage major capsid protein [Xanthobacteraceae bacterium]|nr:phage major capsid protein [Xanthobacteraceae bacterium]
MPILGAGIIPSGAVGLELEATIRRVFAQMVVILIYKQNPLLALLLRNAIRASGGVSPYTQPVQTGAYVTSSWMGPAGQFNIPADVAATVNAEWNMCALATPVTSFGLEQLVTQDAIAVASRLMLKLNDLKNSALASLATALFGTNGANVLQMFGLLDAYDDGTAVDVFGGLSRTTYPTWKGLKVATAGAVLTRAAFIPKLLQAAKNAGGEAIDFVVMSVQDWTTLLTDFLALERYNNDPSMRWGKDDPVNSGFRGLLLGDTPIFFDLNCPVGTAFMFNSKYISLVVHEDANFAWTGWYSTIPQGQIASVGLTLTALNLVCSKPSSGAILTGITGGQAF